MKKLGFTLAEVLITLMILGVIAAMTVPSLIQDTQGKEQVVLMKKGHSMLNQAVTMNYALEQEDFGYCRSAGAVDADGNAFASPEACVVDILARRLSKVADGDDWIKTQDGITYFVDVAAGDCRASRDISTANGGGNGEGNCFDIIISTDPQAGNGDGGAANYEGAEGRLPTTEDNEGNRPAQVLTGYYQFYAGTNRVLAADSSRIIMDTPKVTALDADELGENVEDDGEE